MKNLISIVLIFGILLLAIPAIALYKSSPQQNENINKKVFQMSNISEPANYKMLDISSDSIIEITPREYIIGAVLAQMPASFESESLKTQAVISHTYILRQHILEVETPTENLNGADFSNDTNLYQAYFTTEQAKALYGKNYEVNLVKITTAVDSVLNEIITYNNEPILPAFHSMSGGMTESAKIAWGTDFEYLQAVSSTGEETAKGFIEEKEYTCDELSARLTQNITDLKLSEDKSEWIKITEKSPSGTVLTLQVGNLAVKGSEIKEIFSLRSCYYDISYNTNVFKITTRGVGHGVGLSQYGANDMAQKGDSYDKIISYYYTGIEIQSLK